MAYNSMSIMGQNPYRTINNGGLVKKKTEGDEESSLSSRPSEQEHQEAPLSIRQEAPKKNAQQMLLESKQSEQKAIASRDANLKNASVNIAQIIKDFKNTAKAIGAPPELLEEVTTYLDLVEKQVKKENPDPKLVRSNLSNGASLLDRYITETLQRPSKVVENWINALFLQQINYSFNEEEVNPTFLVKFPNGKKDEDDASDEQQSESDSEEQTEKLEKSLNIPQDEKLKSLFVQAKKYTYAKDYKKAMDTFKAALDRAIEVQDAETESKILYEIGSIYDKNDYLAQALTSYNRSLSTTKDTNIKTKAHYSMAQIYDDVAQFESAINHYMTSISYAGEAENLSAQSTSLTKIGKIYADEYKKEAFDFLLVAENIAKESKNSSTKGYVCGNIANAYNKFNEPQHALRYYSNAIKEYEDAQSPLKIAINYKRAAELMKDYKNTNKAKTLMQKALLKARQTDNVTLMKEIHEALSTF